MPSQAQFLTTAPSGSDQHWRVAASTSAVLILSASQDQRSHASIFNNSVNTLFLTFGGDNVGVTGQYDVKITSASYYELPRPIYNGEIWGLWDATGGWAHILQLGVGR